MQVWKTHDGKRQRRERIGKREIRNEWVALDQSQSITSG
jgi:hypothetical protein